MTALHNSARAALHAQWLAARNRMTVNKHSPLAKIAVPEPVNPEPPPPSAPPRIVLEPEAEIDNEVLMVLAKRQKSRPIMKATAAYFGMGLLELLSDRRIGRIVRPRMIAMFICAKHTPLSLPEIGRRFGGRDHTTVLHATRKIDALIANGDSSVIEAVEAIVKAAGLSDEARTNG